MTDTQREKKKKWNRVKNWLEKKKDKDKVQKSKGERGHLKVRWSNWMNEREN